MPTVVANPDESGINTSANVAEWIRTGEEWAHVYCQLDGMIDFTTGNVFELKLMFQWYVQFFSNSEVMVFLQN